MDKQKQKEEIRNILCANIYCGDIECEQCRVSQCAEALIDASYGNLKEFAERLKECLVKASDIDLYPHYSDGYNRALEAVSGKIDELLKEYRE